MHPDAAVMLLRRERLKPALVSMLPVVQAQDGGTWVFHHSIHQGIVLHTPSLLWRNSERLSCTLLVSAQQGMVLHAPSLHWQKCACSLL